MAPPVLAQHNCPQGFDSVGILKGTGSYGVPFDERRELVLPQNATIDTSFQQSNVRARAGNGLAQSKLQAKEIPKGILIIPSGSTLYDNGWAVSAPELKTVGEQYRFGMNLYCISSTSASNRHMGGCNVNVEVCYKPKK